MTFEERGVIYMTLRNALVSFNLRIGHPECLANLEIKNYDSICRYALLKYFQSKKFYADMETAILDYQEGIDYGYSDADFALFFVKDSEGEYELRVDLIDPFVDNIDTYEAI